MNITENILKYNLQFWQMFSVASICKQFRYDMGDIVEITDDIQEELE